MSNTSENYQEQRKAMVRHQLVARGIRDERVLRAMGEVPRHCFVPEAMRHLAYADAPLPIGNNQTISQPLIVAIMLEALELEPNDRVLDIGTGSGYQAAVLSELVDHVISVEIIPELARQARRLLRLLGYHNVSVLQGDGSLGLVEEAPFDAIVAAAAPQEVPTALVEQLAPGGRLVLPVGPAFAQSLLRLRNTRSGIEVTDLGPCAFVPLKSPRARETPDLDALRHE